MANVIDEEVDLDTKMNTVSRNILDSIENKKQLRKQFNMTEPKPKSKDKKEQLD